MSPGIEVGIYESHEELFGRRATLQELISEISAHSLASVLWVCALVVVAVQLWDRADPDLGVYGHLLDLFFPRELAIRFRNGILTKAPKREIFHRRQILLIAKLAIQHCSTGGIDLRHATGAFGSILLKANDQFHYDLLTNRSNVFQTREDFARIIAEFIAVTEFGKPAIQYQIARVHLLLTEFTMRLQADVDYVNAAEEFEEASGISLEEHEALIFGIHARSGKNLVEELKTIPLALPVAKSTFSKIAISSSKIFAFIDSVSSSPATMRKEISSCDRGPNDFTIFRRFPMVEQWYDGQLKTQWFGYLLIDNHMLIEKQLTAPYWQALSKYGQRFSRFWGKSFEAYVNELLARACTGSNVRFIADVRHPGEPNQQICDGVLIDGGSLTIIESKSAIFTASNKYSGNHELLAEEIDQKLVFDKKDGNKKAALQLSEAVCQFLTDQALCRSIGIEIDEITTIYPLVVTLDSIGGTIGISTYLNLPFQNASKLSQGAAKIVRPLFCVDIASLESMTEYFSVRSLPSLLQLWYDFNPPLSMPFLALPLDGIRRQQNSWLKEKSREIFASMVAILFPNGNPDAPLHNSKARVSKS